MRADVKKSPTYKNLADFVEETEFRKSKEIVLNFNTSPNANEENNDLPSEDAIIINRRRPQSK